MDLTALETLFRGVIHMHQPHYAIQMSSHSQHIFLLKRAETLLIGLPLCALQDGLEPTTP
ncbi:hypothetical protein BFS16_08380 [Hoylesella timonensis]|uniref:Uncharacterized protein n=1 Tax=Hoylesella timonensis TaxID=386414 RepID=A0A2K0XI20_9BACT|nr:hypothetical protein BFS16_08380 [Hoylesella timonensis]